MDVRSLSSSSSIERNRGLQFHTAWKPRGEPNPEGTKLRWDLFRAHFCPLGLWIWRQNMTKPYESRENHNDINPPEIWPYLIDVTRNLASLLYFINHQKKMIHRWKIGVVSQWCVKQHYHAFDWATHMWTPEMVFPNVPQNYYKRLILHILLTMKSLFSSSKTRRQSPVFSHFSNPFAGSNEKWNLLFRRTKIQAAQSSQHGQPSMHHLTNMILL